MARVRKQQSLLDDMIKARRRAIDPLAALKQGVSLDRRVQPNRLGVTASMSFTAPAEIDDLIDKWAAYWVLSRSAVIRQAILMADISWSKRDKK